MIRPWRGSRSCSPLTGVCYARALLFSPGPKGQDAAPAMMISKRAARSRILWQAGGHGISALHARPSQSSDRPENMQGAGPG